MIPGRGCVCGVVGVVLPVTAVAGRLTVVVVVELVGKLDRRG